MTLAYVYEVAKENNMTLDQALKLIMGCGVLLLVTITY